MSRNPAALAAFAERGVNVHRGDFDDPDSMVAAFTGADRLMLISGLAINRRVQQHRNAIEAARKAGVRHIVYTSTLGVQPTSPTVSAHEHIVTEADLRASGMSFSVLRNACYAEIVAAFMVAPALETGKWIQAAGDGAIAPVSKQDIARSAVECLLDPKRHRDAVYEITGPELLDFRQMAAIASEVHGVPLEYVPISVEERYAMFDAMGIPRTYREGMHHESAHAWPSDEIVTAEIGMGQNYQAIQSRHVQLITGSPALSLREVLKDCKGKTYDQC
jgi:NAD(P)H dehydrogenase (quinone)